MEIAQRHTHMNSVRDKPTLGSASSDASARLFVVPTQVSMVTEFSGHESVYRGKHVRRDNVPRPDQMGCGEQSAQDNADAGDHNVCNAEERIATTHDGTSTQEDGLCTAVNGDGEVYKV